MKSVAYQIVLMGNYIIAIDIQYQIKCIEMEDGYVKKYFMY